MNEAISSTDISLGDRLEVITDRRYTVDGVHHWHVFTSRGNVTEIADNGFTVTFDEVVSETGNPAEFGITPANAPTSTQMAWFGWDAAVEKGRARKI